MPENLYPTVSAHRDVKRTFAIRFRYLLMNAVALRPVITLYYRNGKIKTCIFHSQEKNPAACTCGHYFYDYFCIRQLAALSDPTLDLTCGPFCLFCLFWPGPVAGFLIIFKPSVDDKYKALANTALFFIMPVLTIQMVEVFNENLYGGFLYQLSSQTI